MLKIIIPETELFNETTDKFFTAKPVELVLEHSLVSLSKWESKWKKPFLTKGDKTNEETIDYIRCMTITKNVDSEVYQRLTQNLINDILIYIDDPMTATTFGDEKPSGRSAIVTSEVIYYWMVTFNIPLDCQKWHLNKLLTLIKVCNIKNQPKSKMTKGQILKRNRALNSARRARLNTKG